MSRLDDAIVILRQDFELALCEWEVRTSIVKQEDEGEVTISFKLWGHSISGDLVLDGIGVRWVTPDDCPYEIRGELSIWRWISMRMADALDAKPTIYEKDVRSLLISIRQKLAPTERAAIDPAVFSLVEAYPALASDA